MVTGFFWYLFFPKEKYLVLFLCSLLVCVVPDFMLLSQFIKIEMCAELYSFGERFETNPIGGHGLVT